MNIKLSEVLPEKGITVTISPSPTVIGWIRIQCPIISYDTHSQDLETGINQLIKHLVRLGALCLEV